MLAVRAGRHDVVAVVTSLVSVSLDPPTALVSVHGASRAAEVLTVGSRWAATVMGAGGAAHVAWIAEPGRPDIGQLQGIGHDRGPTSGAAVLHTGTAWIECETEQLVEVADHVLVIGRVLAAGAGSSSDDGALVHRLGRVREMR